MARTKKVNSQYRQVRNQRGHQLHHPMIEAARQRFLSSAAFLYATRNTESAENSSLNEEVKSSHEEEEEKQEYNPAISGVILQIDSDCQSTDSENGIFEAPRRGPTAAVTAPPMNDYESLFFSSRLAPSHFSWGNSSPIIIEDENEEEEKKMEVDLEEEKEDSFFGPCEYDIHREIVPGEFSFNSSSEDSAYSGSTSEVAGSSSLYSGPSCYSMFSSFAEEDEEESKLEIDDSGCSWVALSQGSGTDDINDLLSARSLSISARSWKTVSSYYYEKDAREMQTDDDDNPAYVNYHNQHLLQNQLLHGYLQDHLLRPLTQPHPLHLRGFPTEEERNQFPYPETDFQYLQHFL